jgi:hypothetical protein
MLHFTRFMIMRVFQHFWKLIKWDRTNRRQLLIQCGGYGNLHRILTLLRRVMRLNEFKIFYRYYRDSKMARSSHLLDKLRTIWKFPVKVALCTLSYIQDLGTYVARFTLNYTKVFDENKVIELVDTKKRIVLLKMKIP